MPTTKSAKKRLRQSENRRERNRAVKSALRSMIRKVRESVTAKNVAQAEEQMRVAAKKLDQAASKNIIHRNKAARLKSRLQRTIKTAKQPAAATA
jgi:small subunit ribosomal protein S20